MMRVLLFVAFLAIATAFAPARIARLNARTAVQMAEPGPTYWEGTAPPSSVLGVGEKIPSAIFGPLSLVALGVGSYCVHESNIFNQLSATNMNAQYIAGSLLVPISWGMHVAAWIQKQNGK